MLVEDAVLLSRFGAIGDVHGEDVALERALEDLRGRGAQHILVVGDILDGPGDVARCLHLLAAPDVSVVRGNHERWWLASQMRGLPDATPSHALDAGARRFVEALPATLRFETPWGPLLLCHGLGVDDMGGVLPDDQGYALESNEALWALHDEGSVRLVVNGHTHQRLVRTFGALTVINAGTLFRPHGASFDFVDLERREVMVLGWPDGTNTAVVERVGLVQPEQR
jgi:putative phosphoesterase